MSGGRLLDAWDRQFTYAVVLKATKTDSFTSNLWPPTFILKDEKKSLNEKNEGIVVIISHGANGSGAYTTNGKQLPLPATTAKLEWENLNDNPIFVQADYSTHEDNPFDDQMLVLTEDQIVQPLANQGALQTKYVQTLEKLKRIENALIGFIVINAEGGCSEEGKIRLPFSGNEGKVPHGDVLNLEQEDVFDSWGSRIYYIIEPLGSDCFAINNPIKVTLKSRGLDREWDKDNPKNDIKRIVIRSRQELNTILLTAGIKVGRPDPSSSPPPVTKNSKNGPP